MPNRGGYGDAINRRLAELQREANRQRAQGQQRLRRVWQGPEEQVFHFDEEPHEPFIEAPEEEGNHALVRCSNWKKCKYDSENDLLRCQHKLPHYSAHLGSVIGCLWRKCAQTNKEVQCEGYKGKKK